MYSRLCKVLEEDKKERKVKIIGNTKIEHKFDIGDICEVLVTTRTAYIVKNDKHQDIVYQGDCEIL